jgi:CDGSH-type Zn-finger protein
MKAKDKCDTTFACHIVGGTMLGMNRHIKVTKNGPYLVHGGPPLALQTIETNDKGDSSEWREGRSFEVTDVYALCRCGGSANKPFCDGTHTKINFDGTETASREPFAAQATHFAGPTMLLEDARPLCAYARFCDRAGTIWRLIDQTDDRAVRHIVADEATRCPSGRLVVRDKQTGEAVESRFEPSIGLVEDPAQNCSGPIWVRGGIPIESAGGTSYEVRNC